MVVNYFFKEDSPSCFKPDYNIVFSVVYGGQAPYEYSWSMSPSSEENFWEMSDETSESSVNFMPGIGGGDFYLTVTDANGCSSTCEIRIASSCSDKDLGEESSGTKYDFDFVVHPNPAKRNAEVTLLKPNTGHIKVELYNLVGTKVLSKLYDTIREEDISLDLDGLPSQVYYLKISSDNGTKIKKLIIDK